MLFARPLARSAVVQIWLWLFKENELGQNSPDATPTSVFNEASTMYSDGTMIITQSATVTITRSGRGTSLWASLDEVRARGRHAERGGTTVAVISCLHLRPRPIGRHA